MLLRSIENITDMTSRNYCFTIYDMEWKYENSDSVKYCVYQKEKCPSTEREHYQGYIELNKPMRMAGLKKVLNCNAHIESRKGNRDQAREYCMKEESRIEGPWEFGEWGKGQGNRSDLEEVSDMIMKGRPEKEIFEECPETYLRYHSGISKAIGLMGGVAKYRENVRVFVYWGVPGSGKSYRASQEAGGEVYRWPVGCGEPRGYRGERNVIIEEFNGYILASKMKVILDKYPTTLQVPYGQVAWNPENIWITSNYDPKEWYQTKIDNEAIIRRITKNENFVTRYEVTEGNTEPLSQK